MRSELKFRPQILHAAVALDSVARTAKQLQVVDMIGPALPAAGRFA